MTSEDVPLEATAAPVQRTTWHSPVPYLFGGLAAMLGLIAFALLVLACSYYKLAAHLGGRDNNDSSARDVELGEADSDENPKLPPVFEEKFLVIMAGQVKPTFLATPISSRNFSFGSSSYGGERVDKLGGDQTEKRKEGSGDHGQPGTMETSEASR